MKTGGSNESRPNSLAVIEVEPVAPEPGRWQQFVSRLGVFWRQVFPNKSAEAELVLALDRAKRSGMALLESPSLRNQELEAKIAKLHSDTRKATIDGSRSIAAFEAEQALISAQASKALEEAKTVRSERLLRTIEAMRKHGIVLTPIFDASGDLEALALAEDPKLADAVPEPHEEEETTEPKLLVRE